MEITLIAPYSDISSFGTRMLAAQAKKANHKVTLIFLNDPPSEFQTEYVYHNDVLEQVKDIVGNCPLIGISLMSLYEKRIVQLTNFLKNKSENLILWGGIHPTIRPEECLQHADAVAIGEADHSLLQLIDTLESGKSCEKTAGFWFKSGNKIIRNDIVPLQRSLDSLPFPDYFPHKQYALHAERNRLFEITTENYESFFRSNPIWKMGEALYYQTMATRGCPHNCSYCCNSTYRKLYGKEWNVRYRAPEHLIAELTEMKDTFSFISAIVFSDDSFFSYPIEEMKSFAELYKKHIDLPFRCLTSPLTLTEEKLELLTSIGMFSLQMGIQTGSDVTKKLYRRKISDSVILEATDLIHQYQHKMDPPLYDFILDNPMESLRDHQATLQLILKIPRPYFLQLFSLVLFPGTELWNKAEKEMIDFDLTYYQKPFNEIKPTYANMLFRLCHHHAPVPLIKILSWYPVLWFFSLPPFYYLFGFFFSLWKNITRKKTNKEQN